MKHKNRRSIKGIALTLCTALLMQMCLLPVGAAPTDYTDAPSAPAQDYCIFTDQLMVNESAAHIEGSVHIGQELAFTGHDAMTISGHLNGGQTDDSRVVCGSRTYQAATTPDLTSQWQDEAFYAVKYTSDTVLSGTTCELSSSVSVDGNLLLDQVKLHGSGYIRAQDSICFYARPDDIKEAAVWMYAENGNIAVQGTELEINGILYAPNGHIELNAKKLTVNGLLIAKSVELNGTELYIRQPDRLVFPESPPDVELTITGEQKVNRLLTLELSDKCSDDRIARSTIKWEITAANGSGSDVRTDSEAADHTQTRLIVKKAGNYVARATVLIGQKAYSYEKAFSVVDDLPPLAGIHSEELLYRSSDGTALLNAVDTSYSSDHDGIGSRVWSLAFDSDNDGCFDDEEEVIISSENKRELSQPLAHVGRYQLKLKVQEYFDNTLPHLLSAEDYLSAEAVRVVSVKNHAPAASLSLEKDKCLDLILTAGIAGSDKIVQYSEKLQEIKATLESKGYTVALSTVETSSLSAQDSFAWTEYDHINYKDDYAPELEKHILYKGDNIVMMGYGSEPLTDFLFVEDNDSSQKLFSFEIQRDENDWHTMEGGGFLFNSSIEKGLLNGYCILLTQQGLKLIRLEDVNVQELRSGEQPSLQYAGTILATADIGDVLDRHSLRIMVDSRSIIVWDKDVPVMDEVLPDNSVTGYGYGPITSHTCHSCSQQSYFTFGNIRMETFRGHSMMQVLDEHPWTSTDNRFVIQLSDDTSYGLGSHLRAAEAVKGLLENNAALIGLGNSETLPHYEEILRSADGICFDNANADDAAAQLEAYLLAAMEPNDYAVGRLITTDDRLIVHDGYSDAENDPKNKAVYHYTYDYTPFESGNPSAPQHFEKNKPLPFLQHAGSYTVSVKVQDNPSDNESFASYRRWSDTNTAEHPLLVHHLPQASLSAAIMPDPNDENRAYIKLSEDSTDPDHLSEDGKGITERKYAWKLLTDKSWTDGKLPDSVSRGAVYLQKLTVRDKEGAWSRPSVCVISVDKLRQEFMDYEPPVIQLQVSDIQIGYGEKLAFTVGASDNVHVASLEVYLDNEEWGRSQGTFVIGGLAPGEHMIRVRAWDASGNDSTKQAVFFVTDNRDKTPPQIVITSPDGTTPITNSLTIIGSVFDEKELEYFKLEYAVNNDPFVTAAYSAEPVINGTLAEIKSIGQKGDSCTVRVTATDKSGNTAYRSISFTVSETGTGTDNKPIPPVIRLSADKKKIAVGETAEVKIAVSDDKPGTAVTVYKNGTVLMHSPGTVTFAEETEGLVQFRVVATDTDGNISVRELTVTVYSTADKEPPTTEFFYPYDGTLLSGTVELIGTVQDNESLSRCRLLIRSKESDSFTEFAVLSSERTNEVISTLDTTAFKNGEYVLRLAAEDMASNKAYTDITVEFHNTQPVSADYERPYIALRSNVPDNGFTAVDSVVQLIPEASDNGLLESVSVYVNGSELSPDEDGCYFFEVNQPDCTA